MFTALNQHDLHHIIAENSAPTLVFFGTEECASCRHLKKILVQLQARHPEWIIYEVNAQEEMGLTREFEVFHLPAMFLFQHGQFHQEISCEASIGSLETAIGQALLSPAQEAP